MAASKFNSDKREALFLTYRRHLDWKILEQFFWGLPKFHKSVECQILTVPELLNILKNKKNIVTIKSFLYTPPSTPLLHKNYKHTWLTFIICVDVKFDTWLHRELFQSWDHSLSFLLCARLWRLLVLDINHRLWERTKALTEVDSLTFQAWFLQTPSHSQHKRGHPSQSLLLSIIQ